MKNYSPNISVMMKASRKAARSLIRDFGEVENLQVSQKGTGEFVSVADTRSEKIIYEELLTARPNYGFVLEESGEIKGKENNFRWLVDPLDGTNNFIHGYENFCISIGLEEIKANGSREVVAGLIDMPFLKQTFWVEKGKGAWIEKSDYSLTQRLRVSSRKKINESLVCIGSIKKDYDHVSKIINEVAAIRCIGSSAIALALVASGKFDCFINSNVKSWDVAAGSLMSKEAGGYVSYENNGKYIIATNENLHKLILQKLK